MNNGILFKSNSGNKYFYDNITGHIVNVNGGEDSKILNKYRNINHNGFNKLIDVQPKDIESYLFHDANGFKQLILEVTSCCNLRCKYCTYSDNYEFTRPHGNNFMTFDIAKAAVDYYFKSFEEVYNRNPGRKPIISFYGGEPLINFKLIKEVVEYVNDRYKEYKEDIQWHTTTNGLLLDDKAQDFLHENKFNVLISIDGYKDNHDRNRLSVDGHPTFDKAYENYFRFKKRYPKQSVYISACYDLKTNMDKFASEVDEKEIEVLRASMVSSSDKYYSQFSSGDKKTFIENYNKIKEKFFDKAINGTLKKGEFLYNFFVDIYGSFAYHRMIGETLPDIRPCTSTCVPGEKIYVESDGNFILCEKVNNKRKIGNVYSDLNYSEIANILNEYNNTLLNHCKSCEISKFCTLCFKDFCKSDSFKYEENVCMTQINAVKQLLLDYVNLLEQNPKLFQEITTDYYTRLNALGEVI